MKLKLFAYDDVVCCADNFQIGSGQMVIDVLEGGIVCFMLEWRSICLACFSHEILFVCDDATYCVDSRQIELDSD